MTDQESEYGGLSESDLLRLEVDLCTPLKRPDWIKQYGATPHAVRVGLLRYVLAWCGKSVRIKDFAAVLADDRLYGGQKLKAIENATFGLFHAGRCHNDADTEAWRFSREVLSAMLLGFKPKHSDERREVAERIVRFFFPTSITDTTPSHELPPPFFQRDRFLTKHCSCPHDQREIAFYAVSLAKQHYQKKRVRWFVASGGELFRDLSGSAFELWAQRLTAALCFGLELTFVVPDVGKGTTNVHTYVRRLRGYWKQYDETAFADRYPQLSLHGKERIAQRADKHLAIKQVPISDQVISVNKRRFEKMFPWPDITAAPMHGNRAPMYGPTFLNSWLRFHWVDTLDANGQCTPQFTAMAINDNNGAAKLYLVEPQSMAEYVRWVSVVTKS